MRSRYYSPDLRQFLSADSYMGDLYYPASLNPYSYVEGNPVRYIDPMGYAAEPFDLKSASAWLSTYQHFQYPGSYVTEAMLFGYEDALSGGPDNYITMREHHERLYEQTHSGAVHSSHFIQKPLGERLLSAAEIWQRDGLRAALYETGGFLEKGVAIFDNYQKWRHDREPMGCIETAVTAEILHAFVPGLTRLSDWINERIGPQVEIFHIGSQIIYFENPGKKISDVLIPSIVGGVLTVAEHLENAGVSKKIYESTSGAISVMATAAFVIPDIQNTWTADSGNTNFQRVQKTIIQLVGAGASIAVGKASGEVLKAGIEGAGHTGGISLVAAVPIAIGINLAGNLLIQEVQLRLYEDLGIH